MATQNPTLPPGQWVQYNVTTQNPRASLPSPEEQGIGQIRQSFAKGDGRYYQVVWNPGDQFPKSGLYHENQLCALTQQEAQQLRNDMNAGNMPSAGQPGSSYQQPQIPTIALPPELQQGGAFTAGPPSQTDPSLQETT